MSWTCPGHYKVHVHGRDSPGRPVHGHCPVPLPALPPDDAPAWTISSSYNRDSHTRGGGSGSGRQNEQEGGGGSGSGRQNEGGSGSGRGQRESGSGSGRQDERDVGSGSG